MATNLWVERRTLFGSPSWRSIVLTGLLLSGCASTRVIAQDAASGRSTAASFAVSMQVEVTGAADLVPRTIPPGAQLVSGDRFALRIWVDQKSYVYVVRYSKTEWSKRLYPESGNALLSPEDRLRLPTLGGSFRLDTTPGQEVIYVVASEQPMDAATCQRLRLLCTQTAPTTAPADLVRGEESSSSSAPPPPPPDGVPDDERPVEVILTNKQYVLRKTGDTPGLAVLRFAFDHRDPRGTP